MPSGLARSLSWLRANLHEPIDLENLARIAEVPPRTLERHFRTFLNATPLAWVRRMRLTRARQALIDADATETVTDVALVCGFSQLGRFAAQYREHFGELPSDTLRRARGGPAAYSEEPDEAFRLTCGALPAAFAVAPTECSRALGEVVRAHSQPWRTQAHGDHGSSARARAPAC